MAGVVENICFISYAWDNQASTKLRLLVECIDVKESFVLIG